LRRQIFDGFALVNKKEELKMYAFDLEQAVRNIKPLIGVKASFHKGMMDTDIIGASKKEERKARGDMVVAAYLKSEPVAYLFAATTDTWVDEVEDWLNIGPREVYFYDAFTLPRYRGNGIYPFLICAAADYFQERSFSFALIFSAACNASSIRGIQRSAFAYYGKVQYHNFLGWKSWKYTVGERHVKSRFVHEG
jgi:GNAT superfamily N-acetyltransferase